MAQVKLGLGDMTIDEKRQFAQTILARMDNNPNFPTPTPPLSTIDDLVTNLDAALSTIEVTRSSLQQQMENRGLRVDLLEEALELLAKYVDLQSGGDPQKILSSGMQLRQPPAPVGPMPKVTGLVAESGPDSLQIKLRWKTVRGRQSYAIEAATPNGNPDAPGAFQLIGVSSAARFTAVSLEALSRYWFRVRAIGAAGPGPWSDPTTAVPA